MSSALVFVLGVEVLPGRTLVILPARLLSVPLQAVAAEPVAMIRSQRATLLRKTFLNAKPVVRTLNTPHGKTSPCEECRANMVNIR
jgi:hypothetical protein